MDKPGKSPNERLAAGESIGRHTCPTCEGKGEINVRCQAPVKKRWFHDTETPTCLNKAVPGSAYCKTHQNLK